jgi:flavin-dependent dehydrogenase
MSTHFVQVPGMARLARWGLVDDVFASNCPPVLRARFDTGGEPLEFELPEHSWLAGLAAPRRCVLDKLLIDAAVAAGAQLAEGVSIDSLLREDDRVVGIRGHDSTGPFEARGRVVVGADGRHSIVAREAGAQYTHYVDPLTSGYYSYFGGVDMNNTVETVMHEELFTVVFPTNDDLTLVAIAWRAERFKELRRDIDGHFRAGLASIGPLGERILAGERAERFVGSADVPNYIREPFGPGWALVGDAYFHKDPVPADGISDAFRAAEFLAEAIDEVITKDVDEATALGRYRDRHDVFAVPQLDAAVRSASLDRTPQERLEAFFEIRINNQEEVVRLETAGDLA